MARTLGAQRVGRHSRNLVFARLGPVPRVDEVRASARERGVDKIAALAGQPTDLVSLWRTCAEVIAAAVPHYQVPCWYTVDPASLLITSHFHQGLSEFPAEWLISEYYDQDANQIGEVIRSESGVSTLHEATGGDPSGSARWQRNMTIGGDQELVVRLRSRSGGVWGALSLYREPGQPHFDQADKSFLQAVAPHLAEGARRALLVGEAVDPDGPDAPGLLILTDRGEVESASPGLERWMSELPDGDWDAGQLPAAVLAVAGRAKRTSDGDNRPGNVAMARVLSRTGVWIVLHGASLVSGASRRVAVIVEPAHPARIFPLLMSAYGLTGREQDVTRLILQGNSTTEIAQELTVSAHTVQQHLKNIFDKTGVRSRRDLVARVFFAHYEPRFRDNERRTLDGKPVRGEPCATLTSPPR
jgi:DNA-binding CsgD family transcriptional regulator